MKSPARFILFVGAISLAYTQAIPKVAAPAHVQHNLMMVESADKTAVRVDTMSEDFEDIKYNKYNVVTSLIDFPAFNFGIVYFAILLIIVAAGLQLLNVLIFKTDKSWIVFLLIVAGFAAIISSSSTTRSAQVPGRNYPQMSGQHSSIQIHPDP